jgi:MYXO-CTERM domain-containing protein
MSRLHSAKRPPCASFRLALLSVLLSALGITTAQARVSVTTEVTDFDYQVFSIGAPGTTPASLTFGEGGVQINGRLRIAGDDDGQPWTASVPLDAADHTIDQPMSRPGLLPDVDLQERSDRYYGHAGGSIKGGAQRRLNASLNLDDVTPGPPYAVLDSWGDETIQAARKVTLSPHSYARFEAASFTSILTEPLPALDPERPRQQVIGSVSLEAAGPGSLGAGQQTSQQNMLLSTFEATAFSESTSRTLTAYLFNDTDQALTGTVSLRVNAYATLSQASPVPEPESLASMLAGLGILAAAMRRRGRNFAARQAACSGAVLSLGMGTLALAQAAPVVDASIGFHHIQFTAGDLDLSDGIAPSLVVRAPGGFDNVGNGTLRTIAPGQHDESDWGTADPESAPLPHGGLFDVGGFSSNLNGNTLTLTSSEDAQGANILLSARATSSTPGLSSNIDAQLRLSPGSGGGESAPSYSFTLGPRSYATLSMQVDTKVERSGIVGHESNAVAVFNWDVSLFDSPNPGIPTQLVSDIHDNDYEHIEDPSYGTSRAVQYAFYNPSDAPWSGSLSLRAGLVAMARSPVAEVPEAESIPLALAGLGALVLVRRRRRQN